MYIGLIDDDLRKRKLGYPNLELMKLSSYYKRNRHIVELCTDYRQFERYSKIVLRKNTMDNDFPDMFLSKARNKCEYGGYAFTNGIYIPMDSTIEKSLPDVTIYDKINIDKKRDSAKFQRALTRNFIRLETIEHLPYLDKEVTLVYDKAAVVQPLWETLEERGKLVEFVEEQEFNNLEAAIKLASSPTMYHSNVIHYKGTIDGSIAKQFPDKLKVPVYYDLIPEKYNSVSFITGCEILTSYFSKIEAVYRLSKGFKVYSPFTNSNLKYIIIGMNTKVGEESLTKYLQRSLSKDYETFAVKFKPLFDRIKQLRRYCQ